MRKQIRVAGACLLLALTLGMLAGCSKKTSGDQDVVLTETESETQKAQEATPAATEPPTVEETAAPAVTATREDDGQVVVNGVTLMNVVTVKAGDADQYGYAMYPCEMTGTYHFKAEDSENTQWKVYVLDKEYDGTLDQLSAEKEPALEGDGKITAKKGQYFYIYCSANETTQETADPGASYQFGIELITK